MTAFFDTLTVTRRLIYQATTGRISQPPASPIPNGWAGQWYFPEAFANRFPITEQQFWAGRSDPPTPFPNGWAGYFPEVFGKRFPVTEQLFWTARIDPALASPIPNGWAGDFREAFGKSFPVTEQQFWAGRVDRPADLATPEGWPGDFREAFAKAFPAALQQFWTGRIDQPIVSTPQGWLFQQPDLFNKPFIQLDITAIVFPAPPTPQGWVGDFGWKFSVPINAAVQQFWSSRVDVPPPGAQTTGPIGWIGYQPEEFGKALNAALQQYMAFQPQGAIVSAPPAVTTPDPWYPDEHTPWFPDRELYKKLLERLKKNAALRWKQLNQSDKRRLKLRAAVEMAYHGITEESLEAPSVTKTAKIAKSLAEDPAPVVKAVKALGLPVQRRDYDFIRNSLNEYNKQLEFDREDEEDIELLLLHF